MEIRIVLVGSDPPTGQLWIVGQEPGSDAQTPEVVEFAGWLGLLHALDAAIAATKRHDSAG
jgi:hypothetical protein